MFGHFLGALTFFAGFETLAFAMVAHPFGLGAVGTVVHPFGLGEVGTVVHPFGLGAVLTGTVDHPS
jgi:hypothetical protein